MSAQSRAQLDGALREFPRVVLDLDGTIYDTRDFERPALAAVTAWLRERSGQPLPGLTEALWTRREQDRHRPGLFDDALAQHSLPAEWGAECARRFHGYEGDELRSAQSLIPTLNAVRERQGRLALVSNGRPELQRRKLAHLGVAPLFDVCIFCDPRRPEELKPGLWAWQQLEAWRAGLPTIYAGDDPVDAQFAAAASVPFVQFQFRSSVYEH
jgi:phosphoglycolate phosphatase-like HAD superfamily hydrolase